MNATNLGAFFSLSLSLVGLFLSNSTLKYWFFVRLLSFVLFLGSIWSIMELGNRTGFLITGLSIAATLVFHFVIREKKIKLGFLSVYLSVFTFLILICVIIFNFGALVSRISNSNSFIRFLNPDSQTDPRFIAWGEAISGFFEHPFGGKLTVITTNYVHNLVLDVGYATGIFPMFILILFLISFYKNIFQFLRSERPKIMKILIVNIIIGFTVTFALEPIMDGYLRYFLIFSFYAGMFSKYFHYQYKS